MGDAGDHIVKGQHRVGAVILTGAVSAGNSAQNTEDANEINGCVLDPTLAEGGHGDGDQLDAAKEQGQVIKNGLQTLAAEAENYNLKQLKAVNEDGGPNEDLVFLLQWGIFIAFAQEDGTKRHQKH